MLPTFTTAEGGFPVWCIPLLVVSAAMPIYGYNKQVRRASRQRSHH